GAAGYTLQYCGTRLYADAYANWNVDRSAIGRATCVEWLTGEFPYRNSIGQTGNARGSCQCRCVPAFSRGLTYHHGHFVRGWWRYAVRLIRTVPDGHVQFQQKCWRLPAAGCRRNYTEGCGTWHFPV